MIMKGRQDRTAIAEFLNPVNGYRGKLELQGKKPKDHRKENLKLLKQKEQEVQKQLDEESKPKGELFKMKKFQNVPSKLKDHISESTSQRPQTAASNVSRKNKVYAFGSTENVPTAQSEDKENHYEEQDNIEYVDSTMTESLEKHKNFGKVPDYIKKYKEEQKMTEEQKELEKAKAKMPPGTRLMTEEERIQTLEELSKQRQEIQDFLFNLPISMRTEALKNKKTEMERKLIEIEKAYNTFSRKVVYIKDENATAETSVIETPKVKSLYGKFRDVK